MAVHASPDWLEPDRTMPDQPMPRRAGPEQMVPERTVPGQTVPGQTVPGQTVWEPAIPARTSPEQPMPDHAMPDRAAADRAAADQTVPVQVRPAPDRLPLNYQDSLLAPSAKAAQDAAASEAPVETCWLCGIRLDTAQMVADGGRACGDIRWYCRDMRACTERWTQSRAALPPPVPAAERKAAALRQGTDAARRRLASS